MSILSSVASQKSLSCNLYSGGSVTQSCPALVTPMDCDLPGPSVQGIVQARILEWVATSFSWGSSWPRNRTWVSCMAGVLFTDSSVISNQRPTTPHLRNLGSSSPQAYPQQVSLWSPACCVILASLPRGRNSEVMSLLSPTPCRMTTLHSHVSKLLCPSYWARIWGI